MSSTYYDESYPPSLWGGGNPPSDDKSDAKDDDVFFEVTITAQDAPNAAKLTPLGYVANPQTAWAGGDAIYVNSAYRFHWTGTAWAAGLAPALDESKSTGFEAIKMTNSPEEPNEPNEPVEPEGEPPETR